MTGCISTITGTSKCLIYLQTYLLSVPWLP